MSMQQEISNWDGKSSKDIDEVYDSYVNGHAFVANIIACCEQEHLQKGATWLLKHHLEMGQGLTSQESVKVFQCLPTLAHWEARLHLLQCLPYMQIDVPNKKRVEEFLRNSLGDSNKFVRAWAYSGFSELAIRYPQYKEEAELLFDKAMKDEAPSVKARIRNIRKACKFL